MQEKTSNVGMYLTEVRNTKLLTREEEIELSKRIKAGDKKAEELLITSNLRFVISIARQYQNVGIELSDLINEGNLGLIKAARRYDYTMGNKFISYAVWWVKQAILQAINEQSRMIRLPVNISNEILKQKKYFTIDGHTDEIHYPKVGSLDVGFNTDDNDYDEIIADTMFDLPDEQMIKKEYSLTDALDEIISKLDYREQYIINEYFLRNHDKKNLETIGEELGLTKERVRQVRDKALRKIRNNSESLFEFLS
jgi:RNA polymerase primary sigma factor